MLLDDLDWQHSRIRIRAQKGGKEVVLPLMQAVGEALIQYLQHRPGQIPCRKLFLSAKAPFRPLDSVAISMIVRRHLERAGVKTAGSGSRTLRHSWAIRALPMTPRSSPSPMCWAIATSTRLLFTPRRTSLRFARWLCRGHAGTKAYGNVVFPQRAGTTASGFLGESLWAGPGWSQQP